MQDSTYVNVSGRGKGKVKIIESNKREAKVVKVNGKYKLEGSLYNCID